MNSLPLPVEAWWAVAAMAAVIYLTVMVRWMPTPSTKNQVALGPLLAAVFLAFLCLGQHMPLSEALGTVSGGLLGMPLSMVGHMREMSHRILKWEKNGSRKGDLTWPTLMIARYAVTVPGMALLGLWLGK